jgi:hypothetical protein
MSEKLPIPKEELSTKAKRALQAANRSAEKLREQKRRLGQKLVIFEGGKVQVVDP